jgi:FAD binding domain
LGYYKSLEMPGALSICLLAALSANQSALVTPGSSDYNSSLTIYNLNLPIYPAAVTYPSSTEEVAAIVKCASEGNYKVQAKSGGHSYGNYGEILSIFHSSPTIKANNH